MRTRHPALRESYEAVASAINRGEKVRTACKKLKVNLSSFYNWRNRELKRKASPEAKTPARQRVQLACVIGTPKEISAVLRGMK